MRRRTFLTSAAATATAFAGLGATPASADRAPARPPLPRLELPRPTGTGPVGLTTLHLTDARRADPWVPTGKRELMVSLWYPARRPSGTAAAYLTAAESTSYIKASGYDLDPELLSTVVTHATTGAEALRTRTGHPLVVLSPGFGMPRATLSGVAEELASRGYAVAGIGHNYEANGTTFPDGHTTDCVAPGSEFPKLGAVRAADVSFVLDEITGRKGTLRTGVPLDASRIAMAGHSAGGFSTVPAMLRDPRIRAGLNMDGNFHFRNDTPLNRPYLVLGDEGHVPGSEPTWDETWPELTGWKRWLSMDGMQHLSFTDVAPLAKQLGISLQDLDGDRAAVLTRAYVAAFADTHLRGRPSPLLDGPSADHPEVRFHTPGAR
ncbi:alpha/beta hydrolase family protein [Streptomyces sp. NPDC021093]|uniref:alpha/beta hydrolase family protein n=1 Tax=Streptomyces sp. NPDC021093 TaxID=3365112 RepID=UPI00379CE0E6